MPTITAQQLKEKLANGDGVFLVDVRTPEEHAAGNLGGINIPLGDIDAGHFGDIPKDKEVVVYCRSGSRSAYAQMLLAQAGFTNIINLEGGIMAFGL